MVIDPLLALNQFVAAWPSWKLVYEVDDKYLLTANFVSQQAMVDFNPEKAEVIKAGPYMYLHISVMTQATYDGVTLSFRTCGYTYKCSGPVPVITIIPF